MNAYDKAIAEWKELAPKAYAAWEAAAKAFQEFLDDCDEVKLPAGRYYSNPVPADFGGPSPEEVKKKRRQGF